jgi:effector-binding domain-containing protein
MPYQCELEQQAAQPALTMRLRTAVQDLPRVFGETYGAIMQYLGELGEHPAGMPFAAYYNYANMDMQDLDVEIGFPVARKIAGKDGIRASELPAGKVASVMHIGPYDQVGPAYEALTQWVKEQGYESTGVAYEFYYSPPETPPEETRTKIAFPLTPS